MAGLSQELFERDPQLLSRERDARAHVGPAAECQMLADVGPAQTELIRVGEHGLIAIRRGIHECDRLSRLDAAPMYLHFVPRRPCEAAIGRVQPQEFFDGIGDQRGILA